MLFGEESFRAQKRRQQFQLDDVESLQYLHPLLSLRAVLNPWILPWTAVCDILLPSAAVESSSDDSTSVDS
jgi:hypothetical protein